MKLLEALEFSYPAVVAVVGSGGKSTIIERLKIEAAAERLTVAVADASQAPASAEVDLTLVEVHGEAVPEYATTVIAVAGLDEVGEPHKSSIAADRLASELSDPVGRPSNARVVYVLNKADDELRLQQAKQVSTLLSGETIITVDGFVLWPNADEAPD